MRVLGTSAIVMVFLVLCAGTARADGLFYRLPEDGARVRFDLAGTRVPVGMKVDLDGSLRMWAGLPAGPLSGPCTAP